LTKSYFLLSDYTLVNRLKIILENGDSIKVYHDSSDVSVLPKSKLVRTFNEDGSLIEEFKLLDKKIALDDDLDKDQTEIVVTLHVE
jgi:hypothetical protein